MSKQHNFHGRNITLSLSDSAEKALAQRDTPLLIEMELYFSCLIRKAVRFHETLSGDDIMLNDKLALRFRPVMTKHCGTDYEGDEPPLTDFPIVEAQRYIPHWLHIDYRRGEWTGEFGYTHRDAA